MKIIHREVLDMYPNLNYDNREVEDWCFSHMKDVKVFNESYLRDAVIECLFEFETDEVNFICYFAGNVYIVDGAKDERYMDGSYSVKFTYKTIGE